MIALCGLAVAGIPFLTTMGSPRRSGWVSRFLIALTLLPALLGFAGERLRPSPGYDGSYQGSGPDLEPNASRWIGAWLAEAGHQVPAVTVLIVVLGLAILSYPAKDLRSRCRATRRPPQGLQPARRTT